MPSVEFEEMVDCAAMSRTQSASDTLQSGAEDALRYYTVAYGAGTFTVGACSEDEAARLAIKERTAVFGDENALALVMPLSESETQYLDRCNPTGIPRISTVAYPSNSSRSIRHNRDNTQIARVTYTESRLFSWIVHGGTGEMIYRIPSET